MKKRVLLFLLSILSIVCFAFGFSACNTSEESSIDPFKDPRFLYEQTEEEPIPHWRIAGLAPEYAHLTEITIPTFYDARWITEIAPFAFSGNTTLKKVTIGEAVAVIDEYAFYGCTALEEVIIPERLNFIHQNAFLDCESLTTVTFHEGSKLHSIGASAFENTGLEEINLPEKLTYLEENAFKNSKLTKIFLPRNLQYIKQNAFNTPTLKETHIDDLLFFCTKEFEGETANPTHFTKNLFLNGEEIKDLVIPDTVTVINPYVFPSLSFNTIHFGVNVKEIATMAFAYTEKLGPITVAEGNKTFRIENDCLVHYLSYSRYVVFASNQTTTLPENIQFIAAHAFRNNTSLEHLVIPEGTLYIYGSAFQGCVNLKTIEFADSLEKIGKNAFRGCTSLQELQFPSNLRSIGEGAFFGCNSLKDLTISCTYHVELGEEAFANCFNLETVFLEFVYTLPSRVFMNCKKLHTVIALDSSTVRHAAFVGCTSLQSAYFEMRGDNYLGIYKTNNHYLIACVTSNKDILYFE